MKRNALLIAATAASFASLSTAQVTWDRLLHADKEPQNWLTYSGTVSSQRYSLLDQITPANAKNLELKWVFQARSLEKFETTPLVIDGIMYLTEAPNHIYAVDAKSGKIFWITSIALQRMLGCAADHVNRGLAALGDSLFMGTIDGHCWRLTRRADVRCGTLKSAIRSWGIQSRTLRWSSRTKCMVGVAGGEFGIRGFIAAFDAKTGKEAWKFYTVAGPGKQGMSRGTRIRGSTAERLRG